MGTYMFSVLARSSKPLARHFFASPAAAMGQFCGNVSFDHIAREWRCKWSTTDGSNKAPLAAAQTVVDKHLPAIKALGPVSVQRVVCGTFYDFKLIANFTADKFGEAEKAGFGAESDLMEGLKAIDGVDAATVEAQTYTLVTL